RTPRGRRPKPYFASPEGRKTDAGSDGEKAPAGGGARGGAGEGPPPSSRHDPRRGSSACSRRCAAVRLSGSTHFTSAIASTLRHADTTAGATKSARAASRPDRDRKSVV